MHPSKSYNHIPVPDDDTGNSPSPDLAEQVEALKAVMAEAEDLCAEFAIEMHLEAKRISKEVGE